MSSRSPATRKSLDYENAHIANFLKALPPDSLRKLTIKGITQTSCLRKLMQGINAHSGSLTLLSLQGTSKRLLSLLPGIGFCPFLKSLEVMSSSSAPMTNRSCLSFVAWMLYLPSIQNISMMGHDVDYIIHEALSRPSNSIKSISLVITRHENVSSFRQDQFFHSLGLCDELESMSIVDSFNIWSLDSIESFKQSLKHLNNLKKINLDIKGLADIDLISILDSALLIEEVQVNIALTNRLLNSLGPHVHLRLLISHSHPSTIDGSALRKLFSLHDDYDEGDSDYLPIKICVEAGSRILRHSTEYLFVSHECLDGRMKCVYYSEGASCIEVFETGIAEDYVSERVPHTPELISSTGETLRQKLDDEDDFSLDIAKSKNSILDIPPGWSFPFAVRRASFCPSDDSSELSEDEDAVDPNENMVDEII
ncbi:uncharacterized protein V1516DRAFT_585392 [Lipomyces oligophaga]|uniref:uncharacterized protein n=1 Tax=Lipomyces oligophaga TaxID=45792 RepID=UPI0034CFD2A7